jgi:hypothetical protein
VAVAPGAHRIVVSKPNYAQWDTTLTVTAADTATVTPRLSRARVPFVARSAPPGATVLANGRALGVTPLDTTVRAGRAYTIRFEKAGHIPSPRTRLVAPQQGAVDRRVVLAPVETDVEAEEARIEDLTIRRTGGAVDLRYALLGASGERYRVDVAVIGPGGTRRPVPADSVSGAVGAGLRPGGDKRILLRSALPEGGTVRLSVRRPESDHTLLYIAGGALVGGGALAALIFGGGSGGGGGSGSSFPQPPGLPQ